MKLKCIGGAVNGHYLEIGDQFEFVVQKPIPGPVRFIPGSGYNPTVRTTQHLYTRRQVNTPDGKVYFLAPNNWSDYQALQFALSG